MHVRVGDECGEEYRTEIGLDAASGLRIET